VRREQQTAIGPPPGQRGRHCKAPRGATGETAYCVPSCDVCPEGAVPQPSWTSRYLLRTCDDECGPSPSASRCGLSNLCPVGEHGPRDRWYTPRRSSGPSGRLGGPGPWSEVRITEHADSCADGQFDLHPVQPDTEIPLLGAVVASRVGRLAAPIADAPATFG
jgi:hypothetical protein